MVNLNKVLAKILSCPLVVEHGTTGIWQYKKWSDGTAECWGHYSATLSNYSTWNNGASYNTGNINFPSGLFISAPIVTYSAHVGSGFALTGTITNLYSTYCTYFAWCSATGKQSTDWYIYAIGKWK